MSELEDNLKSGYYCSNLDYVVVDSFVIEIINLENKTNFYFEKTEKCTIMTQEDEEDFETYNICR